MRHYGKGKGKDLNLDSATNNEREPPDSAFPGAIKKGKKVMAIMRDNKTWCIAKIIAIREYKPYPYLAQKVPENLCSEYEYYITYLEHDRRCDRWVLEVFLRPNDD